MTPFRTLVVAAALALATTACGHKQAPVANDFAPPAPAAAPATPVVAGDKKLTESWVRAFVERIEQAQTLINVDAISATMADDFHLTRVDPHAKGGESKQVLTREEAMKELRADKLRSMSRTYASQIGAVQVAEDGQSATVGLSVQQTFSHNGHKLESDSDQSYEIALRDGEPKLVSVTMTTTGTRLDGVPKN